MDMKDGIEQSQRDLVGIRAYHQEYLDRRARYGVHTPNDSRMQKHQEQLTRALELLEVLKATHSDPTQHE